MVPDAAEARLVGNPAALYGALTTLQRYWDRNVVVDADPEGIRVRAIGKSAHGSGPRSGDNAVARLARALLTLDLPDDRPWLEWIGRSVDPDGAGLGIRGEDEVAGPLTNNLGIMQIEGAADGAARTINLTYNIRYPVTWKIDDLLSRCRPIVEEAGWKLARYHDSPSLYVPLDQEPVHTLLRVYQEETGDTESKPRTMGGGTYARSTPHLVAFGAGLPGSSDGPAHEPDERIAIDTLIKAARIYAHAFYALAR